MKNTQLPLGHKWLCTTMPMPKFADSRLMPKLLGRNVVWYILYIYIYIVLIIYIYNIYNMELWNNDRLYDTIYIYIWIYYLIWNYVKYSEISHSLCIQPYAFLYRMTFLHIPPTQGQDLPPQSQLPQQPVFFFHRKKSATVGTSTKFDYYNMISIYRKLSAFSRFTSTKHLDFWEMRA